MSQLTCVNCSSYLISGPYQCSCGDRICSDCYHGFIEEKKLTLTCPKCGEEISLNDCFKDKAAENELKNATIKCINKNCPWEGLGKYYKDHIDSCKCTRVHKTYGCSELLLQSGLLEHMERERKYVDVIQRDHIPVCVPAQPSSAAGTCHTQGTLPNTANPVICGSQFHRCLLHLPSQLNYHYHADPDVKDSRPFPSEVMLSTTYTESDRLLIYCSEAFESDTHLHYLADCSQLFPSPIALNSLVNKALPVAKDMGRIFRPDICLPQRVLLGSGGFGVVVEHMLNGKTLALKWTTYQEDVLNAWADFRHPNIIDLLAVVYTVPGCYQLMPRMTGTLGTVVKETGGLYKLGCCVDNHKWQVIQYNTQHILMSVLCAIAYLHSVGYQHCDIKESNILYRKHCRCTGILCCTCPNECKFDVKVSDFDTLKSHLFQHGITKPLPHCIAGTTYYMPPEAHLGVVTPSFDVWSFGIMCTRMCHDHHEIEEVVRECKWIRSLMRSGHTNDTKDILSAESGLYGMKMLSSLRKKCMEKHNRLEHVEKIAAMCMECDERKRITAQQLLQYLSPSQ